MRISLCYKRDTNIDENVSKSDYVLLPVYMLNIKYKDKMHMFAMNGQTGKMVGNVPISWLKLIIWSIGMLAGLSLLWYFIGFFI